MLLLQRSILSLRSIKISYPRILIHRTLKSQTKPQNNEDSDEPIRYSASDAARYKAQESRRGFKTEMPWFQPYVISASLAIFLLYFCVIREENDVDLKLTKNLFDHIEGLEEKQIKISILYNLEHNLSTVELEKRLEELTRLRESMDLKKD